MDYRKEERLYIKETKIIFGNINYFFETLKVIYTILYIEGFAFEFIETFLLDFGKEESLYIKEIKAIFGDINYFFETLKVIYRELYEKEA